MTVLAVENFRPGKTRREVRDGGAVGLYLVIQPRGHKSWALRFRRPNGTPAKLTLGPVDFSGKETDGEPVVGQPLTLTAARRLATQIHSDRARGRDVISDYDAARRRQLSESQARSASTFAAAARSYIEERAKTKNRRWQEQARVLGLSPDELENIKGGLAERWADRPVASIDGHDIYAVTDEARRLGIPGLERRRDTPTDSRAMVMLSTLSRMFGWLVNNRKVSDNPCKSVRRPDVSLSRDRFLTDGEIVKFWQAADAERVEFSALLKMLLLTGCRRNEVAGMKRAEISDDGTAWHIPADRTKNHRPHVVPLTKLIRSLIASVPGDSEFVFTTNGSVPVAIGSKIKARLDRAMTIPPWRIHDLRRTFVTGLAELGVRGDVIELAVNHVSGHRGGIAGVYNRSELMPERRAALERWCAHVDGLVASRPANVTPIHRGAK
jgi:integrase